MKQIIVNVGGLTITEKQRVNEALAKIQNVTKIKNENVYSDMAWFYAPSDHGMNVGWNSIYKSETPTHTPQQVLEMAGMEKQGHVHAELMAQYAEDAKTTDKPWELWEYNTPNFRGYKTCFEPITFLACNKYRRKPKTKLIHGAEIPDFEFTPKVGEKYYVVNAGLPEFFDQWHRESEDCTFTKRMIERGLLYPYTEEGKQAAILHAKAMLG